MDVDVVDTGGAGAATDSGAPPYEALQIASAGPPANPPKPKTT
eukprot:SAG22_NODE_561_length_9080_cov_2.242623_6_plen_43_part_00